MGLRNNMGLSFSSLLPICLESQQFSLIDDYASCRDRLVADRCPLGKCVTRERALAAVFNDFGIRESLNDDFVVCESLPVMRGLSLWLKRNHAGYMPTGFCPEMNSGVIVNGLRNENLEKLTFSDNTVDVWILLDVLEHLFDPFLALREIYRTLKNGGICLFTAPTYPEIHHSLQVAFIDTNGKVEMLGEPEYHGNPQRPADGALVTWRYGYDLPILISRETEFDVEVRRWQSEGSAVIGRMTEGHLCRKRAVVAD